MVHKYIKKDKRLFFWLGLFILVSILTWLFGIKIGLLPPDLLSRDSMIL